MKRESLPIFREAIRILALGEPLDYNESAEIDGVSELSIWRSRSMIPL
jgi:hypothetical protein